MDDNVLIDKIIHTTGIGENVSKGVIDDWHLCIGAKEIYCAFTNFTLSAMLFDKNKKIKMLSLLLQILMVINIFTMKMTQN